MIHQLKIKAIHFEYLIKGKKTFELRKNDRDFKVGDYLALNEIAIYEVDEHTREETWEYTGSSALFQITYVLSDAEFLQPGYVALSIRPCAVTLASDPVELTRNSAPLNRYQLIGQG